MNLDARISQLGLPPDVAALLRDIAHCVSCTSATGPTGGLAGPTGATGPTGTAGPAAGSDLLFYSNGNLANAIGSLLTSRLSPGREPVAASVGILPPATLAVGIVSSGARSITNLTVRQEAPLGTVTLGGSGLIDYEAYVYRAGTSIPIATGIRATQIVTATGGATTPSGPAPAFPVFEGDLVEVRATPQANAGPITVLIGNVSVGVRTI
jgi:hypothetical protein